MMVKPTNAYEGKILYYKRSKPPTYTCCGYCGHPQGGVKRRIYYYVYNIIHVNIYPYIFT